MNLISKVQELAEQLRYAAASEIAQLGGQVEMMPQALTQHVAADSGDLPQRARRAGQIADYLRAQPWPTLGLPWPPALSAVLPQGAHDRRRENHNDA